MPRLRTTGSEQPLLLHGQRRCDKKRLMRRRPSRLCGLILRRNRTSHATQMAALTAQARLRSEHLRTSPHVLPLAPQAQDTESNLTTMAVQGLTSKTVPTANATSPVTTATSRSLPIGLASQSRLSTRSLGSPPPDLELASSQLRLSLSVKSRSDPKASFTSTNS